MADIPMSQIYDEKIDSFADMHPYIEDVSGYFYDWSAIVPQ